MRLTPQPIEQCDVLRGHIEDTPYKSVPCAYVKGHSGAHRFPDNGEDLSDEIRLKRSADVLLATLNLAIEEGNKLRGELEKAQATAEMWKRRAAQHGCNVEEGDVECG